jgi:hypothetical protein
MIDLISLIAIALYKDHSIVNIGIKKNHRETAENALINQIIIELIINPK